jgi:hypothetical protein
MRMLRKHDASLVADFKIVGPEISCIGVGHINCHQRNISLLEDMGHARSHGLFNLEFEHQVNTLGHKVLGIADGNIGVKLVIEYQQLNARCGSGCIDAMRQGY